MMHQETHQSYLKNFVNAIMKFIVSSLKRKNSAIFDLDDIQTNIIIQIVVYLSIINEIVSTY